MSTDPLANLEDSAASDVTGGSICPFCGKLYRVGELICPACGLSFTSAGKTRLMEFVDIAPSPQKRPLYAGLVSGLKPITFQIESKCLALPLKEELVVGRRSEGSDGVQPDVDLNAFSADELGVSRCHIRISHKATLVYVADLGSLNGTWVNGFVLSPQVERLLRDGDSMRLGNLAIKVQF
jgi:FHA domain